MSEQEAAKSFRDIGVTLNEVSVIRDRVLAELGGEARAGAALAFDAIGGEIAAREVAFIESEADPSRVPGPSTAERFGRAALAHILSVLNFFWSEDSVEWCELLARFGYAERVIYDPEKHGEHSIAAPGDELWIFTDAMRAAATPAEKTP